eukprot:3131905-Heterocapsa_arctica.AAC.1
MERHRNRHAVQRAGVQCLLRIGPALPGADGTRARHDPRAGGGHDAAAGKGTDGVGKRIRPLADGGTMWNSSILPLHCREGASSHAQGVPPRELGEADRKR